MSKIIIGLVGRQGSGKGAAADILKNAYGAEVTRFSAILLDVLHRLAIEPSRDHFVALSEALRNTFGEDALSYAVERDAFASQADIVVVDGIRRIEDIAALEPLPNFHLIEIAVPQKIRYERMKNRGEKSGESSMTWEKFLEQEQASTEITIPEVAARAWKSIDNSGSPKDLQTHLAKTIAELL